MTATDTQRAIDAVWRIESPRLIAGLARIVSAVFVLVVLALETHLALRSRRLRRRAGDVEARLSAIEDIVALKTHA